MRKKIKKAFTLVELLVVIAILAILATVSIVGYNSFTKKAKVSNDTALVSQLNTLLKADSMVNGDAKTPTDALKITSEAGYDVEKLTPTTNDYEIIWNQETNQFALLDEHDSVVYGEKSTEEYKNWKFVSEYNANSTYSMYLKNNTSINTINDLKVGLDVGTNTTITAVNYTNSESKDDVVIRTNGGTLTVDAASDTIKHFGSLDKVVITAIAKDSYHEYGKVNGNVEITRGHFVLESGATTGTIKVTETAVVNDVKLTNNTNTTLTIVDTDNKLSDDSSIGESIKITNKDAVVVIGNQTYATIKEALNAAKDGDIVKLIADYRLTKDNTPDTIGARTIISKRITFDFGNYKFIGFSGMDNYNTNFTMIIVAADTTFIADENGGIISDDVGNNGGYAVNIMNGAKLTIKSGTYSGGGTTIQVQKGMFEALGGRYICDPYENPTYGYKFMINCIDAAYKDGTAKIEIKGGTYYKFDPSDSESENPRGSFVAEGYTTEKSADEWYTVVPQK